MKDNRNAQFVTFWMQRCAKVSVLQYRFINSNYWYWYSKIKFQVSASVSIQIKVQMSLAINCNLQKMLINNHIFFQVLFL